jgi:hypothetical protein
MQPAQQHYTASTAQASSDESKLLPASYESAMPSVSALPRVSAVSAPATPQASDRRSVSANFIPTTGTSPADAGFQLSSSLGDRLNWTAEAHTPTAIRG